MKHGYWHAPLDAESQLLTTSSFPFDSHPFNRLSFGVNLAKEVVEREIEEIIENPDVAIYFDNLILATGIG